MAEPKETIEIWKTVVGVQMHFNDMGMRIRSMFVTILVALFASIGFLSADAWIIHAPWIDIRFSTFVPIIAIGGTYLFYFVDRYWYHRLLVGSVKHGITIENSHAQVLPDLALSDAIGKASPYEPKGIAKHIAGLVVKDERFKKTGALHSDGKIEFFYKSVIFGLWLAALTLALLGGVSFRDDTSGVPAERQKEELEAASDLTGQGSISEEEGGGALSDTDPSEGLPAVSRDPGSPSALGDTPATVPP